MNKETKLLYDELADLLNKRNLMTSSKFNDEILLIRKKIANRLVMESEVKYQEIKIISDVKVIIAKESN